MTENTPTKKNKPKPRRTGQRKTIVAGKKYALRVFLGRDAAGKKQPLRDLPRQRWTG
jgi:hypothetical protein